MSPEASTKNENTNKAGENEREEVDETDEHLYKLNGFQRLCAIIVQQAQKCTSCPGWTGNAYAYLFFVGSGPFQRFVGVKVGVSLAFAATPYKWATSGFSVKHLVLAFYSSAGGGGEAVSAVAAAVSRGKWLTK